MTLENVLERTHGISPISQSIAYDTFVNSGKVAGLFEEKDEEIFYSKIESGEKIAEKKEVKRIMSPITTTINVTIEVDTKDDSSVKNFISILEVLRKNRKQSR